MTLQACLRLAQRANWSGGSKQKGHGKIRPAKCRRWSSPRRPRTRSSRDFGIGAATSMKEGRLRWVGAWDGRLVVVGSAMVTSVLLIRWVGLPPSALQPASATRIRRRRSSATVLSQAAERPSPACCCQQKRQNRPEGRFRAGDLVGGGRFEPTTTSPTGLLIASVGPRPFYSSGASVPNRSQRPGLSAPR
jgi:hypothetical protein